MILSPDSTHHSFQPHIMMSPQVPESTSCHSPAVVMATSTSSNVEGPHVTSHMSQSREPVLNIGISFS